jgi:hypothetical protein
MVTAGVVRDGDYPLAKTTMTKLVQGIGDSTGAPPQESVKEYRFFVPRVLDGILVNDGGQLDLGLQVSIHRGGKLRGVRLSGAGLDMSLGASVATRVLAEDLDRRVREDFANSEVEPLGLRYSMGPLHSEPRHAYKISRRAVVDGREVRSRAIIAYYSVVDAARPPEIWPPPNPDDRSTPPREP